MQSLGKEVVWAAHTQSGELCSTFSRADYLHKLLEFFCLGNLSILHLTYLLISVCIWRGSKNPPQNVPLWHIDDLELKALEKEQMQRELSDLPFFYLKLGPKISHNKGAHSVSLLRGWEEQFHHQRVKISSDTDLCKQTYQITWFLSSFPQLFPSHCLKCKPLSCHIPAIYHSLFKKVFKLQDLPSLGLHFPSEDAHVHRTILNENCVLFSSSPALGQLNS